MRVVPDGFRHPVEQQFVGSKLAGLYDRGDVVIRSWRSRIEPRRQDNCDRDKQRPDKEREED